MESLVVVSFVSATALAVHGDAAVASAKNDEHDDEEIENGEGVGVMVVVRFVGGAVNSDRVAATAHSGFNGILQGAASSDDVGVTLFVAAFAGDFDVSKAILMVVAGIVDEGTNAFPSGETVVRKTLLLALSAGDDGV